MKVKFLLVLPLLVAFVVACARPAPTPTPAMVPTPTPIAVPTPTPAPVAPTPLPVAKPTGELRIALGSLGAEVGDPSLAPGDFKRFNPNFDFLIGATPEGELSKELGLARDWEVTHTPTHSTYTFYLREGVRFHDGSELTAEDGKFTLEHLMRPGAQAPGAGTLRANIDKIEVAGKYKLVVTTKKRYGLLLVDLSPVGWSEGLVVPKKYIEETGAAHFNRNPVGTGPYIFKERMVGSYARFEAVERHWLLGVPKYKTITLFLVPEETTRIAMLKVGQADIIDVSRERAKELAGYHVFRQRGAQVLFVWGGNQWQPEAYLSDIRAREALNLAAHREEMVKHIFEGVGEAVGTPYYGTWAIGYKPLPLYPYDPEKAQRLLNEAFPKGVSLTINSYMIAGISELPRVNEALAAYWGKVGVKTKIVPLEYASHRAMQARGELFNTVATHGGGNRPFYAPLYRTMHHSKGLLTITKVPELDAMVEALEEEVDLAKMAQRQWEIARYVRERHMVVALLETDALYAGNPKKVTQWNLGKRMFDYNLMDVLRR